jgi:hypothetical protein
MNQPRRYRVPAREVEAINVATGEANLEAIRAFVPGAEVNFYGKIDVPTPEGTKVAAIGDWIVRFSDLSADVWTHDDFTANFEEAT